MNAADSKSYEVSLETSAGLERRLTVRVPNAEIERAIAARLKQVGKTAKLKGFRPGKVPQKVVQQYYGGQVREIGFLLMLFMPCFYCNVSDAWLFREKSKRLWVTLAGGYFELFLWSLAVFVWRLSIQDTLVHYLAFVVLGVCGLQSLVNFNPLIKLDGYYLLSDWVEVPNLRQRAVGYVSARLRWLLWGARRPPRRSGRRSGAAGRTIPRHAAPMRSRTAPAR